MSTAEQRLFEIYHAYQVAKAARLDDLKAAKTKAEVEAILRNVDSLHALYLDAVHAELEATGPDIERAFDAARAANKAIDDARKAAQALPERIRLTTEVAKSIKTLIQARGA